MTIPSWLVKKWLCDRYYNADGQVNEAGRFGCCVKAETSTYHR